jgi:small subunit ribosomal protein S1
VKILRVDPDERKIGLSRKRVEWAEEAEAAEGKVAAAGAPRGAVAPTQLKGGVGTSTGPLIKPAPPKSRKSRGETNAAEPVSEEESAESPESPADRSAPAEGSAESKHPEEE